MYTVSSNNIAIAFIAADGKGIRSSVASPFGRQSLSSKGCANKVHWAHVRMRVKNVNIYTANAILVVHITASFARFFQNYKMYEF